jgi:hypothetical protein
VVILAAELAKRSAWVGALLIALPLTSVMAMSWLYHDTRDVQQVAALFGAERSVPTAHSRASTQPMLRRLLTAYQRARRQR